MPSPRPPFAKAVALKSLELAIRVWPAESRNWGQALLAETHEVSDFVEALFWALGGVTVFLRSHLSHLFSLFGLSPGQGGSVASLQGRGNGAVFPRHSRFVTAIVLLCALGLYLLPIGREAASTVASSWNGLEPTSADYRAAEKLAARGERAKDARTLAFAAIIHPDPSRSTKLAEEAVSLDPGLVWLYASRFRRPDDTVTNREWLRRLRDSDPANAFVYLLAANAEGDSQAWNLIGSNPHNGPLPDSAWTKQMRLAFQAPRYDSYLQRHLDLTREGWRKAPQTPASLVAYSVWSHQISNLLQIRAYADARIHEALNPASTLSAADSELALKQVLAFGEHMSSDNQTGIERLIALEVKRRALAGLHNFYADHGRLTEAETDLLQIRQVDADRQQFVHGFQQVDGKVFLNYRRRAAWVQSSAVATFVLLAATALAIVFLELSLLFPWMREGTIRRLFCFVADYGPGLVLLAVAAFLFSFRPFALAMQRYRASASSSAERLFSSELQALAARNPFLFLTGPGAQWAFWLVCTIVLAAIAVVILVGSLLRYRAAHLPAR
jgi:hypothetical protein